MMHPFLFDAACGGNLSENRAGLMSPETTEPRVTFLADDNVAYARHICSIHAVIFESHVVQMPGLRARNHNLM